MELRLAEWMQPIESAAAEDDSPAACAEQSGGAVLRLLPAAARVLLLRAEAPERDGDAAENQEALW